MYRLLSILSLIVLSSGFVFAQEKPVTGLSDWTLFIDPGHSQRENMGLYNYSEAEKTLRVALHLRHLLQTETDIDTVYMSRVDDNIEVSLSQRTDLANSLSADFYYSIHSDAGPPDLNSTLMLYGGWRQGGVTIEKTPNGGKLMGAYLDSILTANMRIARRGNYADRTFYQGFPDNHTNSWPYLHVYRETDMASLLSEAGFHTNPYQQQRNINADYKKIEARAAYWAILAYHGIERPDAVVLTGEIRDRENNLLLNGASVEIQGKTYTTDTYASVFNKHSSDPNQLRNGIYYFDDLALESSQMIISHPDYYNDTLQVDLLNKEITFADVFLTSKKPPVVERTDPPANDTTLNPSERIFVYFSRPMARHSVEQALSITPNVPFTLLWVNGKTLGISTDSMAYETEYTLSISDAAKDTSIYAHGFDGDSDGIAGGNFSITLKTGPADIKGPRVVSMNPFNVKIVDRKPPVTVLFDELINHNSVQAETMTIISNDGTHTVNGVVETYSENGRSALTFFPSDSLQANTRYNINIKGHITDLAGNLLGADRRGYFNTGNETVTSVQSIDSFDANIDSWWAPQQSGSTIGIITEQTSSERNTDYTSKLSGSTGSLVIRYGWDKSASSHLIRLYLAPSTTPQSRRFNTSHTIQALVFGDGSGNQFRFMLRDGNNQLEGSSWYTVDWVGWRLISWNLSSDPIIGWVNGNGVLNGNAFVDSFQLQYAGSEINTGFIAFDDFRSIIYQTPVSNETEPISGLPSQIQLKQNFPNPFNPTTSIQFELPKSENVRLSVYNSLGQLVAELTNKYYTAGVHMLNFNASNLASGMYIYRLEAGSTVLSRRMILMK